MNIYICDDNPSFASELREQITAYCAKHDYPCTCELFYSPHALLSADWQSIQVLFLDIDMPNMNGIELAKRIRETSPDIIIVFVTAWLKYAPYGYQVSAFRYLLKQSLQQELPDCMDDIAEKLFPNTLYSFPTKTDALTLPINQVLYLEGSSRRYVRLHTLLSDIPVVDCPGKLSEYCTKLASYGFLQTHRSFLVNMHHIRQIKNYIVYLSNGEELKASERNFSEIRSSFILWKGKML